MSEHINAPVNSVQDEVSGAEAANLYHVIDRNSVCGLNLRGPEDAQAVIKPWNEREDILQFAESNVDDQFVIYVRFTRSVRVRSVFLKLGRGESSPNYIKLYANSPNVVDFEEAASMKPNCSISLFEGEASVVEYPIRTASFTSVFSLSVHFGKNVEGGTSLIYYMGFKGDARNDTSGALQALAIPAENAATERLAQKELAKSSINQDTAR